MTHSWHWLIFIGFLVGPFSSQAAIASESEKLEAANHVVTGIIKYIFTRQVGNSEEGILIGYIVEIMVEKAEKGEGPKSGQVLYAKTTKVVQQPKLPIGVPPAPAIPKEGDSIRAFLLRNEDGSYRFLYNSKSIYKLALIPN